MPNCFLSLGSNMGDRWGYLTNAQEKISERCGKILESSAVFETSSWGNQSQSLFLNQVLHLETSLSALELLHECQMIEAEANRVRLIKWGNRTLDIDLLFYDRMVVSSPELTLPHPHIHLRNFVLVPLAEIAPDLVHPTLQKTIKELKDTSEDTLQVQRTGMNDIGLI